MYEQVTSYLGKLKPAHWKYPENQGDGSDEHPYIAGCRSMMRLLLRVYA